MTTAPEPGRGPRRHRLRTQVAVAFTFTALLSVISLAIVTWSYNRQVDARNRILDRVDPAALTARDVFAALVDQETGVRGYALAHNEQFLDPYEAGRQEQATDTKKLRAYLQGDRTLLAHIDAIDQAATRWQQDGAFRLIAAGRTNRTDLANSALLDRSKTQFDAVRTQYSRLDAALTTARRQANDEIGHRTTQVLVLGIVLIALLVACGVVIWVGLRRLVLAPIDQLGSDARTVSDGDVGHAIRPSGPTELAELGETVELMRRSIVDELATV
jgi:CHASE3 domain sensor protein